MWAPSPPALLRPPERRSPSAAPSPPAVNLRRHAGTPGAGVRAPALLLGASSAGTTIPVRTRATERPDAARGCGRGAGCGGDVTPRSRRSAPPEPRGLLGPVVGRSGPASSGPRRPRWMNYKAGGEEFRLFDSLPDAPRPASPPPGLQAGPVPGMRRAGSFGFGPPGKAR